MRKVLRVSMSTLAIVAECSTKTSLRVQGRVNPEQAALGISPMTAGSAAHVALASWLRGYDKPEVICEFEAQYRQYAETNVPATHRLSFDNVSTVLDEWLELHPLAQMPFVVERPEYVEIPFEYPTGKCAVCGKDESTAPHMATHTPFDHDFVEIVVIGQIDGIVRDKQTGTMRMMEHKTTSRIDTTFIEHFRIDPQNTCYIWSAQKHTGEQVISSYVNAIEFSKLPSDPTRKCPKHGLTYSECGRTHINYKMFETRREQTELDAWEKDVISLARKYYEIVTKRATPEGARKTRQQGKFNGTCDYCDYFTWCATGRLLANFDVMTKRGPESTRPIEQRSGLVEEA